jgi:hypothetical protein
LQTNSVGLRSFCSYAGCFHFTYTTGLLYDFTGASSGTTSDFGLDSYTYEGTNYSFSGATSCGTSCGTTFDFGFGNFTNWSYDDFKDTCNSPGQKLHVKTDKTNSCGSTSCFDLVNNFGNNGNGGHLNFTYYSFGQSFNFTVYFNQGETNFNEGYYYYFAHLRDYLFGYTENRIT